MKKIIMIISLVAAMRATAQDSVSISGYVESYYSYDLNKPADNNRLAFIYSHNRHNEFNVNLAFVKLAYASERARANVAIAAGTYMNANYAAEPGVLKNIFEANAGYKLSKTSNLWLDMGILPSHIGFESAVSKDCWTLTRSILADNSPYFESGAKLSYATANGKLTLAALALNGWQRITRVPGNQRMSWGTQVFVKPSAKVTFNYSTFFGADKPHVTRTYHNFYTILQFNEKIGLTAGFDIGTERSNSWYSPVGILRITPNNKWAFALRGEYFNDEDGIIISPGFKTTGISLDADYWPAEKIVIRLEGRTFKSKNDVFVKEGAPVDNNSAISFSIALSL